jgi:hypothetical protein
MTDRTFNISDAAMAKAMTRERDFWRKAYQDMHVVALAACRLADCDRAHGVGAQEWTAAYAELLKVAGTWRAFVSRKVPAEWAVAPEAVAGEPEPVVEPDPDEVAF